MNHRWLHLAFAFAFLTFGAARADDRSDDGSELRLDEKIAEAIAEADSERIQQDVERLAAQETGATRNSCSSPTGAAGEGITRARDYVFARFQEIEGLHVVLDPYTHPRCPTAATFNVVAWLPGKVNPQRLVVIGGHYDSRTVDNFDTKRPAPGANDSGSQTALVLEAARLLAEGEWDSTLVFIAFAGEEQGLFGSASIAASLSKYFPGAVVTAMLNSDIVGGDNTVNQEAELHQFRLYSPGTPRERRSIAPDGTPDDSSPSRGLMRYIATWATAYVPEMNIVVKLREDRPGRGSDHTSFIDNKFAAVRFMETAECSPSPVDNSCGAATLPCPPPPSIPASCKDFNTSHQHSPFDRVEFVTSEYTARITKLVASTAASLASAPSAPQTFTAAGTNAAVTVRWSAPKFGDVDHYVVAARPTMGNFYGRRFRVPRHQTSATLGPRDLALNPGGAFWISVAAVDARGHESLFAYSEVRCDAAGCAPDPDSITAFR